MIQLGRGNGEQLLGDQGIRSAQWSVFDLG